VHPRALFRIAQHPNIVARGLPTDEAVRSFWVAYPASFACPRRQGCGWFSLASFFVISQTHGAVHTKVILFDIY